MSLTLTEQTEIVFNDAWNFAYYWSVDLQWYDGFFSFKVVALHELGHVLGLGHSIFENYQAVMSLNRPYEEKYFGFGRISWSAFRTKITSLINVNQLKGEIK